MKRAMKVCMAVAVVLCMTLSGCSNTSTIDKRLEEIVNICLEKDLVYWENTDEIADVGEYKYDRLGDKLKKYRDILESDNAMVSLYDFMGYFRNDDITNIVVTTRFSAFPYNSLEKNYYKMNIIGSRTGVNAVKVNIEIKLILDDAGKIADCVFQSQSRELLN